ncbi:MAG: internal scaffolding protein [Wigfec virus K19_151]|nr:MAG: internal scaffolding protein [Wigfec virus K19_151]
MKTVTIRPNGTKRITLDLSQETHGGGADQSFKKQCDINNIMEQYAKTGMLPNQTHQTPQFIDCSQVTDLQTAFNIANNAIESFNSLPPEVRKAMDNNPANLESFILDENNTELLKKHNILITQPIETTLKDVNETLKTLKEAQKPTEKL